MSDMDEKHNNNNILNESNSSDNLKSSNSRNQFVRDIIAALRLAASGCPISSVCIDGSSIDVAGSVVWYKVSVVGGEKGSVSWWVVRRFGDFVVLNSCIEARVRSTSLLPPFPDKQAKWMIDHTQPFFIGVRRHVLANYLSRLISSNKLRSSDALLSFLTPTHEDVDLYNSASIDSTTGITSAGRLVFKADLFPSLDYQCEEITGVDVPAAQILKHDHVVYQINVENNQKRTSYQRWTVLKRYVEFYQLYQDLQKAGVDMPFLPSRSPKVVVDHLAPRFIEKRRLHIECWLKYCIRHPPTARHHLFLTFLGVI